MTTQATNFDTQAFRNLLETGNPWKHFNGMPVHAGKKLIAKSSELNGITEYCEVLDYKKEGSDYFLLVEFVGDKGVWTEFIDAKDSEPYLNINLLRG